MTKTHHKIRDAGRVIFDCTQITFYTIRLEHYLWCVHKLILCLFVQCTFYTINIIIILMYTMICVKKSCDFAAFFLIYIYFEIFFIYNWCFFSVYFSLKLKTRKHCASVYNNNSTHVSLLLAFWLFTNWKVVCAFYKIKKPQFTVMFIFFIYLFIFFDSCICLFSVNNIVTIRK